MNKPALGMASWADSPRWRYGMLVVFVALLANAIYTVVVAPGGATRTPLMNLAVTGMLLVNHLASGFLSTEAKLRIIKLQIPFVAICALYVAFEIFG